VELDILDGNGNGKRSSIWQSFFTLEICKQNSLWQIHDQRCGPDCAMFVASVVLCNDANTRSRSPGACAGSRDEMVPCSTLVEKISDNPVHFIASECDLFPPSHKLGTRMEPMNMVNYHIYKHAHIRK